MTVNIEVQGISGQVLTKLPEDLLGTLVSKFAWINPTDFNDVEEYFKEDGTFYAGYLDKIVKELKLGGHTTTVTMPKLPNRYGWNFVYDYRPLQREAVESTFNRPNGIIQAPPGMGKTVIMAAITCHYSVDTLILVQNDLPLQQVHGTLCAATDIGEDHIGRIGSGASYIGKVTALTIQSFISNLEAGNERILNLVKQAELILVDECHHVAADSYLRLFDLARNVKRIYGVSATPEREDERQGKLEAILGPVIYSVPFGKAIEHGLVCPMTVYAQPIPQRAYSAPSISLKDNDWIARKKKLDAFQKVYKDYIVFNDVRNRAGAIFAEQCISSGISCALIVSRIEHGEEIQKLLPQARLVTSRTPKRDKDEIWRQLRNHEVMAVITTLMDEATDIPSLGSVALMAGGKSSIKLLQRLRSLRTFEGGTSRGYIEKKRGFVFYPVDDAPFLKSHSLKCTKLLRSLVKESPRNKWILVNTSNLSGPVALD